MSKVKYIDKATEGVLIINGNSMNASVVRLSKI